MLQFNAKTVFEVLSNLLKQIKYMPFILEQNWLLINENKSTIFRTKFYKIGHSGLEGRQRGGDAHCAATTKDRVRTESYRQADQESLVRAKKRMYLQKQQCAHCTVVGRAFLIIPTTFEIVGFGQILACTGCNSSGIRIEIWHIFGEVKVLQHFLILSHL